MATKAGKIAEVFYEEMLDAWQEQDQLVNETDVFTPDPGTMQNAGNVIWRPREQFSPILDGWDLTGQEQDIIEETYPAILGEPKNNLVAQRVDDLRTDQFWRNKARADVKTQVTELNKTIARTIALQGSLFYRSNTASGFDFLSEGQAILDERQGKETQRNFILNTRDNKRFAEDLAGRQTVQGRPENTWVRGQIGQNVAGFDVFAGSYLPNLAGGALSTTTTAALSFAPEAGSVDQVGGTVTNVDYRLASIPVVDSSAFNVGDKITISNGATAIESVGLADKEATGQPMTFTVVGAPNGTTLNIFPKPIAFDDAALDDTEKSYANVNTTITSGATIDRLNIDASAKTNLFYDKDAIEVLGGDVPMELMSQFDGLQVISNPIGNGLSLYMVYDARLDDLRLRYRTFVWYSVTMKDPMRAGCAVTFS